MLRRDSYVGKLQNKLNCFEKTRISFGNLRRLWKKYENILSIIDEFRDIVLNVENSDYILVLRCGQKNS